MCGCGPGSTAAAAHWAGMRGVAPAVKTAARMFVDWHLRDVLQNALRQQTAAGFGSMIEKKGVHACHKRHGEKSHGPEPPCSMLEGQPVRQGSCLATLVGNHTRSSPRRLTWHIGTSKSLIKHLDGIPETELSLSNCDGRGGVLMRQNRCR